MRHKSNPSLLGVMAVLMIGGAMLVFNIVNAFNRYEMADCTVADKESVINNDSNEYRVYTDECGVLSVKDSLFATRWDSADVYNRIETGETYDFYVQGGRYPFLSMFPNVLEMEIAS